MNRLFHLRRRYSAKPRRQWWRNKLFWIIAFLVLNVGIIGYNILFSPFFEVGDIVVSGNTITSDAGFFYYISPKLFKDSVFVRTRTIFFISTSDIENYILKIPHIADAQVKKRWPDGLTIAVKEREAQAIWCKPAVVPVGTMAGKQDKCFVIDQEGVIFAETMEVPIDKFVIRSMASREEAQLGNQVIEGGKMKDIISLRESLENEAGLNVSEAIIAAVADERLNIITEEGWQAYLNLPINNPQWQITRLKLVLEEEIPAERRQELEYVDLRFSKVYYKYRD